MAADNKPGEQLTVGWREWIGLPDLGVQWTKVKVDTGALSSSLHAFDLEIFPNNGDQWVRFSIHPWQGSDLDAVPVECPMVDQRVVKSSSGDEQLRPVIRTTVTLGHQSRLIDITLTRRDTMGFRMLLGREALRHGILVDPRHSYRVGRPPLAVRRRNRFNPESSPSTSESAQ